MFPQTSLLNVWFMPWIAIWTRHQLNNRKWRFHCGLIQPKELRENYGLSNVNKMTWKRRESKIFFIEICSFLNVITLSLYIYMYIYTCHESYEVFFARQLLCISYFDCIMNANGWKVKFVNIFVMLIILVYIREKNYCKLQLIWDNESKQRPIVSLSKIYG